MCSILIFCFFFFCRNLDLPEIFLRKFHYHKVFVISKILAFSISFKKKIIIKNKKQPIQINKEGQVKNNVHFVFIFESFLLLLKKRYCAHIDTKHADTAKFIYIKWMSVGYINKYIACNFILCKKLLNTSGPQF